MYDSIVENATNAFTTLTQFRETLYYVYGELLTTIASMIHKLTHITYISSRQTIIYFLSQIFIAYV